MTATAPAHPDATAPSVGGGLTLADLLREERFRLAVVAGHAQLHRPVAGAHSVEADLAGATLDRDWVVLTFGSHLRGDEAQRRFVADLDRAGAAGLGLCVGERFEQIPEALRDEAERRGLPLLVVPRSTPAREVISFVQRSLVSEEALAFSRMAALQRFLMDALGHDDPRGTLVARLAEFLGAHAGILEPSGQFAVATADGLPGRAIVDQLAGRKLMTAPFDLDDLHGHAFALGDPEQPDIGWLVLAVPRRRRLHPLAKAAGNVTVPLLGAVDRLDAVQRERDGAARQAALDALLEAETPQSARVAAAQLELWEIRLADGVAVVALEDIGQGRSATELLAATRSSAARLVGPALCTVRGERVLALLPAPASDDAIGALAAAAGGEVRAGVGRVVTDPSDVRRSASEAELAIGAPGAGAIGRYDDLDLGTLVLQELHLERLAPKIEAWLAPLRGTPRVYETLVAYFEHNLDVGATAGALHLHPNSVRYRLARAEELIGAPVRSPSTMIALHVAMAADGGQARAAS